MDTLSLGTGGEPPERTACAGPGRDPEGQRLERNREALWDAELTDDSPLCVLLLGSSALLVQKGLSESLAGRFILFRCPHWGYPGAYSLSGDEPSWGAYVRDSLIETTLARDVLQLQTVGKPALLRHLFLFAASSPAHIVSYNKMLGQLVDAGNTTTLAHYLQLLGSAFLLAGLEKFRGGLARTRPGGAASWRMRWALTC